MTKHLHKCPECGLSKDSWHHGNVCPDGPKLGQKSSDRAFHTGWSVVKGWEEDMYRYMEEMENRPSDMCQLCRKDMNDEANLSPRQHEAMLDTGAFPDFCIHCQKKYDLPGDF